MCVCVYVCMYVCIHVKFVLMNLQVYVRYICVCAKQLLSQKDTCKIIGIF